MVKFTGTPTRGGGMPAIGAASSRLRSAWVAESVSLSVCPQHNSKTNDPKVFKLGVGNDLGIP